MAKDRANIRLPMVAARGLAAAAAINIAIIDLMEEISKTKRENAKKNQGQIGTQHPTSEYTARHKRFEFLRC